MIPIIMQTFNRVEYTIQVIAAIRNNILHPYQLIVVDNGSIDGTIEQLELMRKQGLIHHLVLNDKNLGIAEPKNQGLKIVDELAKTQEIKYVCITDNDIVPPFIRDNGCALKKITEIMDKHEYIGMCGVDLARDNAPPNQEWWWRLRQHPLKNPTFAEIAIGFWFAVTRYEYFKDFKFNTVSLYGRVDESFRNWLTQVKKAKVGLLKGVSRKDSHGVHIETIPKLGYHLGWTEDYSKHNEYVLMKKRERFKAERIWKQQNKVW